MKMTLRYDMRAPSFGAPIADLYEAAVDQVAWADGLGFSQVFLGEHHGAEDGYLCSPITLAAAMAAVSKTITLHLSALVVTLHNPLALAEDLAALDIISRGRVRITAGMGYRPHEFEMFGLDINKKLAIMNDVLATLKSAWTGQPFDYHGRTVQITPTPITPGGPPIMMGGSSEASARRAARGGYGYSPAGMSHLYELYAEESRKLGHTPAPPPGKSGPTFLHVTEDPERDWPIVGPHIAHTTNLYHQWSQERAVGKTNYLPASSVDELKETGLFKVVTPEQCLQYAKSLGEDGTLTFQPLMGGLDPEISWNSLRLFETAVLPKLKAL